MPVDFVSSRPTPDPTPDPTPMPVTPEPTKDPTRRPTRPVSCQVDRASFSHSRERESFQMTAFVASFDSRADFDRPNTAASHPDADGTGRDAHSDASSDAAAHATSDQSSGRGHAAPDAPPG